MQEWIFRPKFLLPLCVDIMHDVLFLSHSSLPDRFFIIATEYFPRIESDADAVFFSFSSVNVDDVALEMKHIRSST